MSKQHFETPSRRQGETWQHIPVGFFRFIEIHIVKIYVILMLFSGVLTFMVQYQTPSNPIWDEVYHISSAQKYRDGTLFMEAHPPLGKLLIAAGEVLISPNVAYDSLNPIARACLYMTPASYKYTEGGVQKTQTEVSTWYGKRAMNLLDVRQKTGSAINTFSFNETDSIKEFPDDISFCGYRFFPVLFAACIPLLMFLIVYTITRNPHISVLGGVLVAFDNALVVHFRAAMLDGIQLVFILLAFLFLVRILKQLYVAGKPVSTWSYSLVSILVSLVIATKHNGLIFVAFPVLLVCAELFYIVMPQHKGRELFAEFWSNIASRRKKILYSLSQSLFAACIGVLVYMSVFVIHIGLGSHIVSSNSNNNGLYKASETYISLVQDKSFLNPLLYTTAFDDNQTYMKEYHEGVPKLNLYSENENGSYPANWPVMNKTISYRWDTADGKHYSYIYLVGNPIVWVIGLISLIFALNLILSRIIHKTEIKDQLSFYAIVGIVCVYMLYMAAMMYIITVRVMYLYHYFIPLVLSLILAPLLIFYYNARILKNQKTPTDKEFIPFPAVYAGLLMLICLVILGFVWYSPFTYHLPLTHDQFKVRRWFEFWHMKYANEGKI